MNGIDKNLDATQGPPSFEELGLTRKEKLKEKGMGQDEFLTLMVTQMKNQDPMKPMENGEFISQMAQFSAARGMREIKQSFTSLAEALQSSQALQASSMVGRDVLIPGNQATLTEAGELKGSIELKNNAPEVEVSILDSAGQLMKKIRLGRQQAGKVQFSWNGDIDKGMTAEGTSIAKADPGQYRIKAHAIYDGKPEPVDTLVVDKIESVSLGKGLKSVTLNLGINGSTTLSKVKEIM